MTYDGNSRLCSGVVVYDDEQLLRDGLAERRIHAQVFHHVHSVQRSALQQAQPYSASDCRDGCRICWSGRTGAKALMRGRVRTPQ